MVLSCIFHHFPLPREKLPEVFFQATDGFPSFSIIFHCSFFFGLFSGNCWFFSHLEGKEALTWANLSRAEVSLAFQRIPRGVWDAT
jgi:hypothetical protein